MKGSGKAVAFIVLALILLAAAPVQQVRAQTGYSEQLQVDIAGSSALWYMTFTGVNATSKLSAFESTPGLSWFNVTAIDTAGWTSDFQVFGPNGYDLLPVPFLPSQGAFLTVGSDSFADALAAASSLDAYLFTAFVSYSNVTNPSGGNFTFYSPFAFNDIAPKTLLALLPTSKGGFANAIQDSAFEATRSPIVTLEGVKASGSFDNTLVVGSIYPTALAGKDQPDVLSYFGSSISYLQASNTSTSSVVQINVLDGLLGTKDDATVRNSNATSSGSYTLNISPGEKIYSFNATVMQAPAELLAYRTVYPASVFPGDNISVTVSLTDLSASYPVHLNFTDNWWQGPGFQDLFRLVANTTFPTTIANGTTVTPVYVLQYVGNITGKLTIPDTVIPYSFSTDGFTFDASSALNPVPLSIGAPNADVLAYILASAGPQLPVGIGKNITVVAVNEGTLPASSVTIAGSKVPGLAANGGTAHVNVTISAAGLTGVVESETYSVGYASPQNPSLILSSVTNSLQVEFSQASMQIGFPRLAVSEYIAPVSAGLTKLEINFTTSNLGPVPVQSFNASGVLPAGIGCGKITGPGIECSAGEFSLNYVSLSSDKNESAFILDNVTLLQNYILSPVGYSAVSEGYGMSGDSNALAIPTGLVATKQFSLASLFPGMTPVVNITAKDSGPFAYYNATIKSTIDSFDTLVANSVSSMGYTTMPVGQSQNFSYGVKISSLLGKIASTNVTSEFYFGGVLFEIPTPGPSVQVNKPLEANFTTSPASPVEGQSFVITIKIINPSDVGVSDVDLTVPFEAGTTLSHGSNVMISGRTLTLSNSTLAPDGTFTATADVVASSGTAANYGSATLAFSYGGAKLSGTIQTGGITVGENVTIRYLIPIAIVTLAMVGAAYYVRKRAFSSAPASPK